MKNITNFILESQNNNLIYFMLSNINMDKKMFKSLQVENKKDLYINGNGPYDFIAVSKTGAENLAKIMKEFTNAPSVKEAVEMHKGFADALRGNGEKIAAVIPNIILDDQLTVKHINDLKNLADTDVAVYNNNGKLYTTFFVRKYNDVKTFVIPEIINHTTKSFKSESELFNAYPVLKKYM